MQRVAQLASPCSRLSCAAGAPPGPQVMLPSPCTNEAYEAAMAAALGEARRAGVDAVAFGDIFLEDVGGGPGAGGWGGAGGLGVRGG